MCIPFYILKIFLCSNYFSNKIKSIQMFQTFNLGDRKNGSIFNKNTQMKEMEAGLFWEIFLNDPG